MSEVGAVAGAVIGWLGGALLVVADGRGGVALGTVVLTAGLALGTAAAGQPPAGVIALAAGGAAAAALRLRGGRPGWGLLAPGSTPRLVGAIVVAIGAALVAGSASVGPEGVARLGGLAVAALAAGRILTAGGRWAALGGASALALGLGAMGGTTSLLAAAAVAVALGAIDGGESVEVGG